MIVTDNEYSGICAEAVVDQFEGATTIDIMHAQIFPSAQSSLNVTRHRSPHAARHVALSKMLQALREEDVHSRKWGFMRPLMYTPVTGHRPCATDRGKQLQ